MILFSFFLVFLLAISTEVTACKIQDVQATTYSTTDGLVIAETAYVAVFTVTCKDGSKPDKLNLYAEIGNKIVPVAKSVVENVYQVSWTQDLVKAYSGTHEIKLYDEEGLSNLKRAQRSDSQGIEPLYTINLKHPGTYNKPWFQTERIAALASIAVCYLAFKHKMEFN